MVFALQGLEDSLAGACPELLKPVVCLCIGFGPCLLDVGDVVLFGEESQLILEELFGILVALCGDGLLESFANLSGPCLICAGKSHGTVYGVFHFGVDMLHSGLEHCREGCDGFGRSLHEGLHLGVEVCLFLYGDNGEDVLDDGLRGALPGILRRGVHGKQECCYYYIQCAFHFFLFL